MKSTDDQGLIPVIVASEADSTYIRTIPTAQPAAGDGSVSLDLGLPPECATSVAAGGKRPEMKDMNGIWNLFSRAIQSLQAYRGVYSASFAAAIGGYPKYALVSDSSGNFWVSTADDNTTVPGATGANWKSLFDGYITKPQSDARYLMLASTALQTVTGPVTLSGTTTVPSVTDWASKQAVPASDADGRYVKGYRGSGSFWPVEIFGVAANGSSATAVYASGASSFKFQPYGDYATNSALNAETTRATTVENNLQSSKVNRSGDTMTGSLNINTPGGGVIASGNGGGDNVPGGIAYSAGFQSSYGAGSAAHAIFRFINVNGVGPLATIWLTDNEGTPHELRFGNDDRLRTASGNVFALTSELSNYVSQSQYTNDFATSDSRVINLPYGHRIQGFIVAIDGSGVHDINFPQAFSGSPTTIVISHGLTNGSNSPVSVLSGWTATGFQIQTNGATSVNFLAMGPK